MKFLWKRVTVSYKNETVEILSRYANVFETLLPFVKRVQLLSNQVEKRQAQPRHVNTAVPHPRTSTSTTEDGSSWVFYH